MRDVGPARFEAFAPAWLVLSSALHGCGGGLCDAGELVVALGGARAGDTIRLGSCRIDGSFVVPPGVALEGVGSNETVLVPSSGDPGIVLAPGASAATCARRLSVDSAGPVAILARGSGSACIDEVSVRAALGVGIGVEDLTAITLSGVNLSGPVTPANEIAIPDGVAPTQSATHGLVFVRVAMASLSDVHASGFAATGVLFSDSNVTWTGGRVSQNLALGLLVDGGHAVLTDIELSDTLGMFRVEPPYGGAFLRGASVESHRLRVNDGAGAGLFHSNASGLHDDIEARNNRNVAVWFQDAPSFELSGQISDNRIAGLVAVDSADIIVHDARIDRSIRTTRTVPDAPPIEMGDGIQLVRTSTGVRIRDVSLDGNERIGLLVDLDGATLDAATVTFSSVVRPPDIRANDLAVSGRLTVVEVVGPCSRPRLGEVATRGLVALIGF